MNSNRKKLGFTIAEVMVVILILTIIFAAFAPLITSKKRSTAANKGAIWSWHGSGFTAGPMDAYFDAGDANYSGTAVIGISPESKEDISTGMKPSSKLIIRSGGITSSQKIQRQIQFRYGDGTRDRGDFAGTWLVDGKNMLLGGEYQLGNVGATKIKAKNNTAIGYESLTKVTTGKYNTAFGSNTLANLTTGESNTALGAYAGSAGSASGNYNTFVGSYAGQNSTSGYNTLVGYAAGKGAQSSYNTYIGANAGPSGSSSGQYNVGAGDHALMNITTGQNNTAIGSYALQNLTSGSFNTAIGYNACGEVTTGSYKTCIGYNSGPHSGSTSEKFFGAKNSSARTDSRDGVERTYIGSKPYNYGGDAVLEIHNLNSSSPQLINNPSIKGNTTTVINGNLIVRGRTFFTVGNQLIAWNYSNIAGSGSKLTMGNYARRYTCSENQTSYSFNDFCPILYSDRRVKNIGQKSTAGLNEINKLQIYNYTYKNDKAKLPHVGVMAQDLIKVFPTAVSKDANGYYRIRWDEMFYASINAIKQLDRKIVALIDRTTKVESQIAQLEKENITLKTQVSNLSARVERLKNK